MAQETKNKSKIELHSAFGDAKAAVAALTGNHTTVNMGVVIGRVQKVISRTMPNGDLLPGLAGFFETIPANEKQTILKSGVCFFPSGGVNDKVALAVTDAQAKDENAFLDFRFKVEAVKSEKNATGYQWQYTPEFSETSADPIAHLRNWKAKDKK